jgi:hypothetical protein
MAEEDYHPLLKNRVMGMRRQEWQRLMCSRKILSILKPRTGMELSGPFAEAVLLHEFSQAHSAWAISLCVPKHFYRCTAFEPPV